MSFIDKIAIGTTKLGISYGLVDQVQIDENQSAQIFSKANQLGFNCFDTAPSYGCAETLIGKYLAQELRHKCVTKVAKIPDKKISSQALLKVEESFQTSLQNMRTQSCYGLLVHDVQDLYKPGAKQLVDWMQSLKVKGLVNKVGVSVYTPKEAEEIFQRFDFDIIQLPYNVFDQRFLMSGVIETLANQGVEIHARSLFLKGLFLKDISQNHLLAENFPKSLLKHKQAFSQHLSELKLLPYDVCLNFAKAQKNINRWVVGVSSEQQLSQLIDSSQESESSIDFDQWVFAIERELDPRNW